MTRLRKAWMVSYADRGTFDYDIVHAPTAAKAKGSLLPDMIEVGYSAKEAFLRMSVRRSPANDIALPDEHWLVPLLTHQERRIVLHAFGADGRNEGYRDHYCTAPSDRRLLRLAWEFGLFSGPHGERAYGETPGFCGAFFHLTALGRDVARSMLPTYR